MSQESLLLHGPFARKPKRIRTAFSPSQLLRLERAFEKNHYVVGAERKQLATSLSLSETQVSERVTCLAHLLRCVWLQCFGSWSGEATTVTWGKSAILRIRISCSSGGWRGLERGRWLSFLSAAMSRLMCAAGPG